MIQSKYDSVKITLQQFNEWMGNKADLLFTNCDFVQPMEMVYPLLGGIKKNIIFENCSFSKLNIRENHFVGIIQLNNCKISESVNINNCTFHNQFLVSDISCPKISIWNNDFLNRFDLFNYEKVDFLKLQFKKVVASVYIKQRRLETPVQLSKIEILFEEIEAASLIFEDMVSKEIELFFPKKQLTNAVNISDITAHRLKIVNLRNRGNNVVRLERLRADQISLFSFHNDGWLSLHDVNSLSENNTIFGIYDSYLGKAELYHVNFCSFEKIQIYNCHLQDIVPVNVNWNFKNKAYKDTKSSYLRELFRQLKNVCSKNMDKISQLRFEKLEMQYFGSELSWKSNLEDWFIFKTNQLSNNHGQSWIRPLLWLFGISLVFYTLINYFFGYSECYHIGKYFNFIMPFHNLDEILCIDSTARDSNNWIYFWDILQRLFSGYFIFQFLRAFRRFV